MAIFVVDSSFFIQAHRSTLPLDLAVTFWNRVQELSQTGDIISIDKVRDELYRMKDDLTHWCRENLSAGFFKQTDAIHKHYTRVIQWAHGKRNLPYDPKAIGDFLAADRADAFLCAFALAAKTERVVVTQEVEAPDSKSSIKIPDCCNAFDIRWMNTNQMLRELGVTF